MTTEEILQLTKILREVRRERHQLPRYVQKHKKNYDVIVKDGIGWAYLYDLDFLQHFAVTLCVMGLNKSIKQMQKMKDPTSYMLQEWIDDEPDEWIPPTIAGMKPDKSDLFACVMSLTKSMQSIELLGSSINSLLVDSRENNNDYSLFRAIEVDHTVVSSYTAMSRISKAEIEDDYKFFKKLKKHINSRTHVKRHKFTDLRYVFCMLEETEILKNMSADEQYQLFAIDTDLYVSKADDPVRTLQRNFQKWRKLRVAN